MPEAITFSDNERVLCYHGPLIYEAKIMKSDTFDETNSTTGQIGAHHFVHYKGWKQTWDEWVPVNRLLKLNETNVLLQKQLAAQTAPANASAGPSKASHKASSSSANPAGRPGRKDGARGTKRGREEDENRKPDMKITIPDILKHRLVDEWENVTKNNQLVTLPREPTVVQLLAEFEDYVLTLPPGTLRDPRTLLPTITAGLQLYFDRSLGTNLLYRFERPQYATVRRQYVTGPQVIIGQEKEMSAIYGAEHLLRMIVNMPQMVASSTLDGESVQLLKEYVNELLNFMVKEKDRIFQQEYETTPSSYLNLSKS